MENLISTQFNGPDDGFVYNGFEDNSFDNVSYISHHSDRTKNLLIKCHGEFKFI